MIRFAILCTVTILTLSCSVQTFPESAFYREFNLGALVKQMHPDQLQERTGSSGYEASPPNSTYRRRFDIYYSVNQVRSPFDETDFEDRLRMQIAASVRRSGASFEDWRFGEDGTSLTYSDEGHRGTIEFNGQLFDGHRGTTEFDGQLFYGQVYKVSAEIQEKAFGDPQ